METCHRESTWVLDLNDRSHNGFAGPIRHCEGLEHCQLLHLSHENMNSMRQQATDKHAAPHTVSI